MSSGRSTGPCSPCRSGDAPVGTNPRGGCWSLCECLLCANTPKSPRAVLGTSSATTSAALAVRPRMTLCCPSELLSHHLLLLGRIRVETKYFLLINMGNNLYTVLSSCVLQFLPPGGGEALAQGPRRSCGCHIPEVSRARLDLV